MTVAKAMLAVDGTRAVAAFRAFAEAAERPVEPHGDGIRIGLMAGGLVIEPRGKDTAITVDAADATGLQLICDTLVERLAGMGLVPEWQEDMAGKRPGNQALARIAGVTRISPSYSRVVIEGEDLGRFANEPLHFRLLMGPADAPWPVTDETGATDWPGGIGEWHRPVYTTREAEPTRQGTRLSFDVFRHDGGRVTAWCDRVSPGGEIALTGPGGRGYPAPVGWLGLVGDETAMPVMARILSALPSDARGAAAIVVPHSEDIQQISHPEGVMLRWCIRGKGETPLSALASLPFPDNDRHIFFAAEKSEAEQARKWLNERGFQKGESRAAAYWTAR
ncbi:siderophore-interacting protein [Roseovarius sp. MMSF_3281]|uniref:siderophore-interacting protein n=1 Tax=Roseovarius sp. MMSF_3281 TaxID=3046694 RepID=UPI00274029F7|nr:siderophore-interacting protein [Roseovarius sp. MMSF_3281]